MGFFPLLRTGGHLAKSLILVFVTVFGLESGSNLVAQDLEGNTADLYRSYAPVQCRFNTVLLRDTVYISMRLSFVNDPHDSLEIQLTQVDPTGTKSEIMLSLDQAVSRKDHHYVFKWIYPKDKAPQNLAARIFIHPRAWIFRHVPLTFMQHPNGGIGFSVNNQPWFDSFLNTTDVVQLNHPSDSILYAFYYDHNFLPARSPITLKAQSGGDALKIDSVMPLPVDEPISFTKAGLYFIQADTNGIEGVSLWVAPEHYPKVARIDQLTEPLIYLTTKEEFEQLKEDLTDKKSLDRFWLSTIGNTQKARKSISRFYKLVATSNQLFTSYKGGWKTDRGMIYIVMGPPDVVQFDGNKEIWKYSQKNGFTVQFTFQKVSNLFSENHFELIRDPSLGRTWFTAIDRWRKGLIDF